MSRKKKHGLRFEISNCIRKSGETVFDFTAAHCCDFLEMAAIKMISKYLK